MLSALLIEYYRYYVNPPSLGTVRESHSTNSRQFIFPEFMILLPPDGYDRLHRPSEHGTAKCAVNAFWALSFSLHFKVMKKYKIPLKVFLLSWRECKLLFLI